MPGIQVNEGLTFSSVYLDSCGHVTTSPLYAACQEGHLEIVKLLLDTKSIDPYRGEVHDAENAMSCLGISIYNGKWEIASLILKSMKCCGRKKSVLIFNRDPISEILLVCMKGNVQFLKDLLESKLFDLDHCVSFPIFHGNYSNMN